MRRLVLGSLLLVTLSAQAQDGFKPLFNGKDLTGWEGNPDFWRVEDGCITGQTTAENPTKGNTFLIWRQGELDDFELVCEYKIINGNSGIQYRSFEVPNNKWVIGGYQGDFEAGDTYSGILYGEKYRGILAKRGEKTVIGPDHKPKVVGSIGDTVELQKNIKKEDWNEYRIVAKGFHFQHFINGKQTIDVTDEDTTDRRRIGLLALQLHAGPPMKVQFRNLKVKRLPLGDKKKVVLVAGRPSHPFASHEHNAGCMLLAERLNTPDSPVVATVYRHAGWPNDPSAFDNADGAVFYCDGGKGHFVNDHLQEFDAVAKKGVGLACLHYGVEVEKGPSGDAFLRWIGGYFEADWSVNPHWDGDFKKFPDHPITRGVQPFKVNDEWYYHMRFPADMKGVTPILTDLPPKETLSRPDGHHSGNPAVRAAIDRGEVQHVAWAFDRPDGGRGFGFTGGHFHNNWANDSFRKLVLNAILWVSKAEVPAAGFESKTPTPIDLLRNQDKPIPADIAEQIKVKDHPEFKDKIAPPKAAPKAKKEEKKAAAVEKKMEPKVEKKVAAAPATPAAIIDLRDAKQAVSNLKVADGVQCTLFAAEPMMLSPSNIDIDARGRVWVLELVNYRHFANANNPLRPEGDRIVILDDTDGDGVADKSTVFYQGTDIDAAMGICVLGNKVIVSCSPNVLVLTDTDGDDKADKKEFLFTNTGKKDHDHSAHAFVFGPDGRFYWNFGNTGQSVHDKDGKPVIDRMGRQVIDKAKPYREGMVFRCGLDGGNFETLAWNFRNNYEVAVDSFGALWQSDNDDDGNRGVRINFVMEYGNYGYKDEMTGASWQTPRTNLEADLPQRHWHLNDPGVVPNFVQTGNGSPTGICVYEGRLLPKPFWDQVIHCDAGPNIVRAYPAKSVGAGYEGSMLSLLDGAADKWFRPSDVCVAPDGSVFVADWYDPGVGGHRMGDINKGRLFRIAPPGAKYQTPKLDLTTAAGAVNAMKSPNLATRALAWQKLFEMKDKAHDALMSLWQDSNPRFRARALWLLARHDANALAKGAMDPDENVRACALRAARWLSADPLALIRRLAADPSPVVRRECAIALREQSGPDVPSLWARLAMQHDGHDRWQLEALGIAAEGRWDAFMEAWQRQGGNLASSAGRDLAWRSRSTKTADWLARIILDPATSHEDLPRYFRSLDFLPDSQVKQTALQQILSQPPAPTPQIKNFVVVEALARLNGVDIAKDPKYRPALEEALKTIVGTKQYLDFVARFNLKDKHAEVMQLALAKPTETIGIEAIRLLLDAKAHALLADAINQSDEPKAAQLVTALGASGHRQSDDVLLPIVKDPNRPLEVRRQATTALAKAKPGAMALVKLAESKSLDPSLHFAAAAALAGCAWEDLRAKGAEILPQPVIKNEAKLPPVPDLVKKKGNAAHGKVVFDTTGTCIKCHKVGDKGAEVGPTLTEIGSKLAKEALYESILFPSAAISHNFETHLVATDDGEVVQGVLVSETADQIVIKTKEAIARTIPTAKIAQRKKDPLSLMPADLTKQITPDELVDLVEYMQTLKKKG